jgi:hypothetical protein
MAIRDVSAANGTELPSSACDSPHDTTSQRKMAEAIDKLNDLSPNCRMSHLNLRARSAVAASDCGLIVALHVDEKILTTNASERRGLRANSTWLAKERLGRYPPECRCIMLAWSSAFTTVNAPPCE